MEKSKLVIKNGSPGKLLMFQDTVKDKLFVYGEEGLEEFIAFIESKWASGRDVVLLKSEFKRRLESNA